MQGPVADDLGNAGDCDPSLAGETMTSSSDAPRAEGTSQQQLGGGTAAPPLSKKRKDACALAAKKTWAKEQRKRIRHNKEAIANKKASPMPSTATRTAKVEAA